MVSISKPFFTPKSVSIAALLDADEQAQRNAVTAALAELERHIQNSSQRGI
jgi:hypothetical protein